MRPVILVASLPEFVAEVPPPALVRLSLADSRLDLQAWTRAGLVWLSDSYTEAAPAEVREQLPAARDAIAGWLAWQGYEVRPGRWATPRGVQPVAGRLVRWREVDGQYQLQSPSV